ncbi:hypothetical protein QJS66_06080 [Kocuria rhizophila]|nr:hypothetical protein QJS66_06080 [Kocuria rhizophila]
MSRKILVMTNTAALRREGRRAPVVRAAALRGGPGLHVRTSRRCADGLDITPWILEEDVALRTSRSSWFSVATARSCARRSSSGSGHPAAGREPGTSVSSRSPERRA